MPPPPANHEALIARGDESPDIWENQYLGHGAKAEWKTSGFGVLDSAGENDVGKIIIQGAEDRDITVKANFRAVIGPLNKSLPEIAVNVPKGGSVEIPVDMRFALGLHERQYSYTTRIHGDFNVDDASGRFHQSLEPRYLAVNEKTGALEIMDMETREQIYPYGLTTEKEIAKEKEAASKSQKEGYFLEGVGSGILIEVPIPEQPAQ